MLVSDNARPPVLDRPGAPARPIIAVMSRFPLVLNRPTGGIEVGFDSAVLVFLACYQDPASALVIWCFGQTLSQITRTKRPDIRIFNVGLGFLSGFVAVSVMLSISQLREPSVKQLLAVGDRLRGLLRRRLPGLRHLPRHRGRHADRRRAAAGQCA